MRQRGRHVPYTITEDPTMPENTIEMRATAHRVRIENILWIEEDALLQKEIERRVKAQMRLGILAMQQQLYSTMVGTPTISAEEARARARERLSDDERAVLARDVTPEQ